MPRVLIILPAYNEAEALPLVLESLRAACPDHDVLVVNDGSRDATAQVAAAQPGVAVVSLPFNVGIGGAMQTGFKYAYRHAYDIAVQCDADGQHPVDEIHKLVEKVEAGVGDVVLGSRYVADTDYTPSLSRRIGKSLLSRWVDFWIGGGITDTTSGFRALNRKAIALFADAYPEDYPEPEALVILHRHGLVAKETPVNMRPRQGGSTSITPHRSMYYMVKVGLAIWIGMLRARRLPASTSE